jgi:hypothetical protein
MFITFPKFDFEPAVGANHEGMAIRIEFFSSMAGCGPRALHLFTFSLSTATRAATGSIANIILWNDLAVKSAVLVDF